MSPVKQYYLTAHKNGVTGPILNLLFPHTITAGKQVSTLTDIGNSSVHSGYAAVELAHKG